jgi:membrane protease YdiL (CAAX protease family)
MTADAPTRTLPDLRFDARTAARVGAAVLVCGAAILLFAVHVRPWGCIPLIAGVLLGLAVDRKLGRDLSLIALGQVIISTISLEADLSNAGIAAFTVVLSAAVVVPYLISRFVFHDDAIRFRWRGGWPWNRAQWIYIGVVVLAGYLILPFYFIDSGAYLNWPEITGTDEITRLFFGVNAVGIWDELFFIATVFALLRSHFPVWLSNVLQSLVFVSFLWELGYREWGPLLTIPFALIQGWIFSWTKTLPYVLTVHLLFDAVVFMVLVHAHHPELFDIFITAP